MRRRRRKEGGGGCNHVPVVPCVSRSEMYCSSLYVLDRRNSSGVRNCVMNAPYFRLMRGEKGCFSCSI